MAWSSSDPCVNHTVAPRVTALALVLDAASCTRSILKTHISARFSPVTMPRLGSKKSRNGCIQCKVRRVKVFQLCTRPNHIRTLPLTTYSAMKIDHAVHARDIA